MEHVIAQAMACLNTPYRWGGSHPLEGMDCSGFVQYVLSAAGADPKGDQSAQALYDYFSTAGDFNKIKAGALAFYGKNVLNISHVAFCLNEYQMIEAGGGDSTTLNADDARKRGAMVRIRLIKSRPDLVAVIRPRYVGIGQI
jgi:cell wall-associated NlpC family hydrolase